MLEERARAQGLVRVLLKHVLLGAPAEGTFAHLLLRVRDPATGRPLSDKQMLPEIAALFFAGIDTTGAAPLCPGLPAPRAPAPAPDALKQTVCCQGAAHSPP